MNHKQKDPHNLIGKEVKAADGGDYGHRVLAYLEETQDYVVQPIKWSTGEFIDPHTTINEFKITYRYKTQYPRQKSKYLMAKYSYAMGTPILELQNDLKTAQILCVENSGNLVDLYECHIVPKENFLDDVKSHLEGLKLGKQFRNRERQYDDEFYTKQHRYKQYLKLKEEFEGKKFRLAKEDDAR